MLLAEIKPEALGLEVLLEDPIETFGPTKVFHKFYGNYCGLGNKGGEPIDDVDCACADHDKCYHVNGRHNPECDRKFVAKLDKLLSSELTFKQRAAATLMKAFFVRALRHEPETRSTEDGGNT